MKRTLTIQDMHQIESVMLKIMDEACEKNGIPYYLFGGSVLGAIRHQGPIPWDADVDITVPLPYMKKFCDVMTEALKGTPYRITIPGVMDDLNNITTFPRIAPKNADPRLLHIDVFPQIGITDDRDEQVRFVEELTKTKTLYRDKRVAHTVTGQWWKRLAKATWLRFKMRNVNADEMLKHFNELCARYPYETARYVTNPCGHYGLKNIVPKAMFGTPRRVAYQDMLLPVPEMTEDYLVHYYKDYRKFPPQEEIDRMKVYTITVEDDGE